MQWQSPLLESKGCMGNRIIINIGIRTNIGIRIIIKGKVITDTGIVGELFTSARLLAR